MAQFDVYRNPSGDGFVLDVQAELLDELKTRVVIPLLALPRFPKPAKRLNPLFTVARRRHVMATQFMAAIPVAELREPIGTLALHRDEIIGAIDMLLSGV
jgi:toxin CcdB